MKQSIKTEKAPGPLGPYSQAVQIEKTIYVSGQGPIAHETGTIKGETIQEQTRLTLDNVKAILEAAGASMANVIKTTVHLSDLAYFQDFNEIYKEYFSEPYPARTTVGSQLLGIKVEIDVIAELSQNE